MNSEQNYDQIVGQHCDKEIANAIVVAILKDDRGGCFLGPVTIDEAAKFFSDILDYELSNLGIAPALETMCDWHLGVKAEGTDGIYRYSFDREAVKKYAAEDWNYRGSLIYKIRAVYPSFLHEVLDEMHNRVLDGLY